MNSVALERPPAQFEAPTRKASTSSAGRPSDVAVAFLQALDASGRHNLVSIVPDGPIEGHTFEPGDWAGIAIWIESRISAANLYFSVNEPAAGAPHQKLKKGHIANIRSISVDLDPGPGDLEAARAAILARLKEQVALDVPQPTIVVDSGAGFHCHWLLSERTAAASMKPWAENQSRALAERLGGDHVQNIDRILRLPGTINFPDARKREAGRVRSQTKIRHQIARRFTTMELSAAVQPLELAASLTTEPDGATEKWTREIEEELRRVGYDETDDYAELEVELRAKFDRDLAVSASLANLWAGDLAGDDQSGSAFRAKLAVLLGRLGTYSAVEFAQLCWTWEHAVQPEHDRNDRLTPRALSRDWCRIAGPALKRTEQLLELVSNGSESSPSSAATAAPGGDRGAGPLVPTPYSFPASSLIPPRQWLYGNHLIRRFISATVAPGGLGKSSLTIVEAMAMATGKPLLGVRPRGQFRVWLWNGEDPIDELYRRINAAIQHYGLTESDFGGRLFVDSGRQRPITLAEQTKDGAVINGPMRAALLQGLRDRRIDALFIDPFISSHKVTENDNNAIDVVAKAWGALADEADIAIELVHHVRKTNGAEVTVEDARGAGSLVNAARSVRALNRMTADEAAKLKIEDDHRLFFRFGGDPKSNLAPPPATDDTHWKVMRSVLLGNGDPQYPVGDSVGVVEGFKATQTLEEAKELAANSERLVVARAVLEAAGGETEVELAGVLPDVIKSLIAAGVTRSDARHITRDKITAALAPKGGVVVEHEGQIVRLQAVRAGGGSKAPWQIRLDIVSEAGRASGASSGVFA